MRLNQITSYELQNRELRLHFGNEAVCGLSMTAEDVLRLRFNEGLELQEDPDRMVVEQVPELLELQLIPEKACLRFRTSKVEVLVEEKPARISAYQLDGRLVFSTKPCAMGEVEKERSVLRVALDRNEGIWGLGQDPMGNVQRNGHERRMWNEWGGLHVCANAALPFYLSSHGYGLLLNSGWPSRFAVGEAKVSDPPPAHSIERSKGPWDWNVSSGEEDPDDMSLILENGRMDVFVVLRSGDEAIRGYGELTGAAPLPPKWAFGYFQSKNRYRTDEEFLTLGKTYREKKIPCDVLVLDWLWFHQFGDMEWDKEYWKDPEGMLRKLHEMNFHVMQAYHPFIYEDCLKVQKFREKGYLMGTPANTLPIFDHSNPEAREAWWQETKRFVDQGIDAYWIDMGEPRDHPQGTTCHLGSREHVHNLYSSFWAKSIYDGHVRDLKTRPFLLSRTSYAGIQRYGAALWSNDIDSSWEVLRDQVPVGIGVCASGLPYWCTDIGGFATDERFSPELFVRWLQWGVFCPLMRTHGTRAENEAWSYGSEAGPIIRKYIELRYRLLPYIYSCAREVYETSKPMLRGLFLDYPNDEKVYDLKDEYLFGPSLLIAPILNRDQRSRQVYLPEGEWFDFWTNEKISGGRTITAQAPLSHIPVYVKAGSLLPLADCAQFVGDKPESRITVRTYGDHGQFVLYNDAGEGRGYQKDEYVKTLLSWENGQLTAQVIEGMESMLPSDRTYQVECCGEDGAVAEWLHFDWDQTTDRTTRIHITGDTKLEQTILQYEITLPEGMKLTHAPCYFRKTPLNKGEKTMRGLVDFQFDIQPERISQPVIFPVRIQLHIQRNGQETECQRTLLCGYGYVNDLQILGFFEPNDPADAVVMARVESGELPYSYLIGESSHQSVERKTIDDGELSNGGAGTDEAARKVFWKHCVNATCFGYQDMRAFASKQMKNGRGTGYASFTAISPDERECSFEFSADRTFALWVNGELAYEKDGMQLKQVPETKLRLHPGENRFLVRCFVDYPEQRSGREVGFSLSLLNENGQPAQDLLYHA